MTWTDTATLAAPPRTGGWTTDPAPPPPPRSGGWYTSFTETVAGHTGGGTLTAVIIIRQNLTVAFTADGRLHLDSRQTETTAAGLGAGGALSAYAARTVGVAAMFRADTGLTSLVNDGLSAIVAIGCRAVFGADGSLSATTVGGVQAQDGLSAAMYQTTAAYLAAAGALTVTVVQRYPMPATLAGAGTLSATAAESYPRAAAHTGAGVLSATVIKVIAVDVAAQLGGTGVLSAVAVIKVVPSGDGLSADMLPSTTTPPPVFTPTQLPGLQVWLDADTLVGTDGSHILRWPDRSGGGHDGYVYGSPTPVIHAAALNGRNVVRFNASEGKINGLTNLQANGLTDWQVNYTVIYLARMVGPTVNRVLSGSYPDYSNYVVGYHAAGADGYYNGAGWVVSPAANSYAVLPTPWRMYGVSSATATGDSFYIDGVLKGTGNLGQGLSAEYNLSGYDKGTSERSDCEVAELIIYHRALTDSERIQVENYLRGKWLGG